MPPALLQPFVVRGARSRNRVMVSPMCTYSAGGNGHATDFHLVNAGRWALGGAGIVMLEATAVERRGRISGRDLGLWSDDQIAPLHRVADFVRDHGSVPAIQLAHAGRRAGTPVPWDAILPATGAAPEMDWPVVGPSAEPSRPGRVVPAELTVAQIDELVEAWAAAATRAKLAGFDIVELHGAHGYLLHSFLSPLSNHRQDEYGGAAANRMRFPLRVVAAVRAALGEDVALSYRLSAVDGVAGGLRIEDGVAFGRELVRAGVDMLDCSSGGISFGRALEPGFRTGFAFHTPYSRELRAQCDAPVVTVGLVVEPEQAEAVLAAGEADVVAVGREMLVNPNWAALAEVALGADHRSWHRHAGWYLHNRERELHALAAAGETPMSRYGG